MTLDELLFNTAVYLAQQTARCANDHGGCVYAGPDGNACAIGCHLPRELAEELDTLGKGALSWRAVARWANELGGSLAGNPSPDESQMILACQRATAVFASVKPGKGHAHTRNLLEDLQDVHDRHLWRNKQTKVIMIEDIAALGLEYGASDALQTRLTQMIELLPEDPK